MGDAGKADQYVKEPTQAVRGSLRALLDMQRLPGRDIFYLFVCRTALGFPVHTVDAELSLEGGPVWAAGRARAQKRELGHIPGLRSAVRYHSQVVEITDYTAATFQQYGHR